VYELLVVQFYVKGFAGYTANEDNDDNHNNEENYFIFMTGEAIL
jgi:hypothetical protein